ncbi:hypothetical protein AB0L00_33585 [Actinoallomurus sp. NPDC052308]
MKAGESPAGADGRGELREQGELGLLVAVVDGPRSGVDLAEARS